MTPDLAFQTAMFERLCASVGVIALVPVENILDRNARPNPDPSIILGESQSVDDEYLGRDVTRIYHTLHLWKKELSLTGVKKIAGEVRAVLHKAPRLILASGFHCADCSVSDIRFLRDPDGVTSHGVVTVSALVQEVA